METDNKVSDQHVKWTAKSEADLAAGNDERNENMWQLVKRNRWAIFYCCCMTVSPMLYGFDVITVGVVTAMPEFQYGPTLHPLTFVACTM